MSNPTQAAVAVRDTSPRAMIAEYRGDFATVLPTHVRADTFVRVAQGAGTGQVEATPFGLKRRRNGRHRQVGHITRL